MLADKDLQLNGLKNILEGNSIEKAGHDSKVEELEKQLTQERMKFNDLKKGDSTITVVGLESPSLIDPNINEVFSEISDVTVKPNHMLNYFMKKRELQLT